MALARATRRPCGCAAWLATLLWALGAPAAAQSPAEPPPQGQPSQTVALGGVCVTVATSDGLSVAAAGVTVRDASDTVVARGRTDTVGRYCATALPPGLYRVRVGRRGFALQDVSDVAVTGGEAVETSVTLSPATIVETVAVSGSMDPAGRTSSAVALSGDLIDLAPVQGDSFQALLPLLPGIVRGADGRLRLRGALPSQSAYQMGATSLTDPSTNELGFEFPIDAIETVEVPANPYLPERGRFSAGVADVRTLPGGDRWAIRGGGLPHFRTDGGFWKIRGLRSFRPRLTVGGPLGTPRLQLAQTLQYRFTLTEMETLPGQPVIRLNNLNAYTRVDGTISPQHKVVTSVAFFPQRIEGASLNTFNPLDVTSRFEQRGYLVAVDESSVLGANLVSETNFSAKQFDVDVDPLRGSSAMTLMPDGNSGSFFNTQRRHTETLQFAQTLTRSFIAGTGEHVVKVGADLLSTDYDGSSASRPVEVRRSDGTLAERWTFDGPSDERENSTEIAVFAQDRWRLSDRWLVEGGVRVDRDGVLQRWHPSPRGGLVVALDSRGDTLVRGGAGVYHQRTALMVGAFDAFERRTITRADANGVAGAPMTLTPRRNPDLNTPYSTIWTIEIDRRFGSRLQLKTAHVRRESYREFIVEPREADGVLALESRGRARYWEQEVTGRYSWRSDRELIVSYVRSKAFADLNAFDEYFGNFRIPVIRANEYSRSPSDVPHRVLVRGRLSLPWQWEAWPVWEWRSGFPFSRVNESQQFVGARNEGGRFPRLNTLDLVIQRPFTIKKRRLMLGARTFNVLGRFNPRDVQTNVDSPMFGAFTNPIERSIGLQIAVMR